MEQWFGMVRVRYTHVSNGVDQSCEYKGQRVSWHKTYRVSVAGQLVNSFLGARKAIKYAKRLAESMIEVGQQYDNVRPVNESQRWQVVEVDAVKRRVLLRMVGVRVGAAPATYRQAHRKRNVPDRFNGWPLAMCDAKDKWIDLESLVKSTDYAPVLNTTSTQRMLFG